MYYYITNAFKMMQKLLLLILGGMLVLSVEKGLFAQSIPITPAEFDPSEGIFLTWDYSYSRNPVTAAIAGAVQESAKVWIIYYPGIAPMDTTGIRNYKIIRVPAPPKDDGTYATTLNDEMRTYTNSLTINDAVIVPSYDMPFDTIAENIYEEAMPGYRIELVDARVLTPLYGAIHCITREIPEADKLLIRHSKITGPVAFCDEIEFKCIVTSHNPVDNVKLYYRTNPNLPFTEKLMANSGNIYQTTLQGLEKEDTVNYYIKALSTTNTTSLPYPGAEGAHKFWFHPFSIDNQQEEILTGLQSPSLSQIKITPNPVKNTFTLTGVTHEGIMKIKDLHGQTVFSCIAGSNRINVPSFMGDGVYILEFSSSEKTICKKMIIKR
ncbi:MAG: agmatine deiminase family protein [Bacteroidales bacterium]|nr:agmatine deiminase family protein [Bacteroidales bacterium]